MLTRTNPIEVTLRPDLYAPVRTREPRRKRLKRALDFPAAAVREMCNRSFYRFLEVFWHVTSADPLTKNWHIEYLCQELQEMAERVGRRERKTHDLLINIPPGTTKTTICMIMFPVWCWTRWHWMRLITASYSADLSLESAEYSRDIIRSPVFQKIYHDLEIRPDKDTKHNYRIAKRVRITESGLYQLSMGGSRFSTSVGGALTGFHGHILLVDDPINPKQAVSTELLAAANRWIDQTLSTRKVSKTVTPTITIMQRLHQDDPSGHMLAKKKDNLKHICLPGELNEYEQYVQPPELKAFYRDNLLDPIRLSKESLEELKADLGQYGYAGQIGQNPTAPGGGMFKVNQFHIVDDTPAAKIETCVRYWDKAGTEDGGAYTAGVKIAKLTTGHYVVMDVKRARLASHDREDMIYRTAEADGRDTYVVVEQEPGSGGKESAESTIRMLAGYMVSADRPTGDKVYRADPYSVQVNRGNVWLMRGEWNKEFIDEHRYFPLGKYKDQVDSAAGAFNTLTSPKRAGVW